MCLPLCVQQGVQDTRRPTGSAKQTGPAGLPSSLLRWGGTDMHMDTVQGGGYCITNTHSATFVYSMHAEYQESAREYKSHRYNFNE